LWRCRDQAGNRSRTAVLAHDGVLDIAAPNSDFHQVVLYLGSTGALKCR
jgi:hypothetical protein